MTYDDLLTRLHDTLAGPGGEVAAARLRARYRIVLVDEFQDTDPVQWDIVRRAFGGDGGAGRPDPHAGADRRPQAGDLRLPRRRRLRLPRRRHGGRRARHAGRQLAQRPGADRRLRRAVRRRPARARGDRLPDGPRRAGQPGPAADGRARHGAAAPARRAPRRPDDRADPRAASRASDTARDHVAADLAADLVRLLSSGAEIEIRAEDGSVRRREPIRPAHVAVLVRTHRNAALVRDALDDVGVPAVINGAGSVFASRPARDWLACWRRSSARPRRPAPAPPRSPRSSAGTPSGSRARPRRSGRRSTAACTSGRACCASRASRR